jgi:FkbM family methyltransferase
MNTDEIISQACLFANQENYTKAYQIITSAMMQEYDDVKNLTKLLEACGQLSIKAGKFDDAKEAYALANRLNSNFKGNNDVDYLKQQNLVSHTEIKKQRHEKTNGIIERTIHNLLNNIQNFPYNKSSVDFFIANIDKLEKFYHLLKDDYSKKLLIELLKIRIIGEDHVKLPINQKEYWEKHRSTPDFIVELCTRKTDRWSLNHYSIEGDNGPIEFHSTSGGVLSFFLLEQYAYKHGDERIQVQPNDVVLEGGSCWGDSALYFADKVGRQGKVYCFEFTSDNLDILRQNINFNHKLKNRIEIVTKALWNTSDKTLSYSITGPSTSVARKSQGNTREMEQVKTISIDDFFKQKKIEKVDFIKMDIEGSELRALYGSEHTIIKHKPKLAISLYHKPEDFITIPFYLNSLSLGYEFFLDHFTSIHWETVLFARTKIG